MIFHEIFQWKLYLISYKSGSFYGDRIHYNFLGQTGESKCERTFTVFLVVGIWEKWKLKHSFAGIRQNVEKIKIPLPGRASLWKEIFLFYLDETVWIFSNWESFVMEWASLGNSEAAWERIYPSNGAHEVLYATEARSTWSKPCSVCWQSTS